MEKKSSIIRTAFNESKSIGAVYDAITDNFVGPNIFTSSDLSPFISRIDGGLGNFFSFVEEKKSDKFKKLGIEANLSVSAMTGLLKISGNANYMTSSKSTDKSVKYNVVLNQKKCEETLNIYDRNLNSDEYINISDIQKIIDNNGTHFVYGIEWGANVIGTFEFEELKKSEEENIKGSLQIAFSKLSLSVDGQAAVDIQNNLKESFQRSTFTLKSDCDPYLKTGLVNSYDTFKEYLSVVPDLISKLNQGKGIPIRYHLYPIQGYISGISLKIEKIITEITNSALNLIQDTIDDFQTVEITIGDLLTDCNSYRSIFNNEIKAFNNYLKKIKESEINFNQEVCKILVKFRSGGMRNNVELINDIKDLIRSLDEFEPKMFMGNYFTTINKIKKRYEIVKNLSISASQVKNELHFIENYDDDISKFAIMGKELEILFLSMDMINLSKPDNMDIISYFRIDLETKNEQTIFLIVDFELDTAIFNKFNRPIRPLIINYNRNGKRTRVIGK